MGSPEEDSTGTVTSGTANETHTDDSVSSKACCKARRQLLQGTKMDL